jgi:hypothetical protein
MSFAPVSKRSLYVALSAWALACLAAACGSSSITVDAPSGVKCQVTPSTSVSSAPAAGASGTLSITTTRDCTWAVTSGASWIAITSADHGQGSGTVSYRVAANADPAPRSATLVVNDTPVPIAQDPAPCRFTVSLQNPNVPAAGGPLAVTIDASAGACKWTAASLADWVIISSASSGTGSGTVSLTVRPNTGGARTGSVVVAGQTLTIAQPDGSAPCTYAIAPAGLAIPPAGGTGTVTVTAGNGCSWTAVSSVGWITVTAGSSGSGNGNVTFSVAGNGGATRTGTITIGGQVFTVTQASVACTYAIAPAGQTFSEAGGTGTVTISAPAGCSWTATSNVGWASVTGGAAGSGNGTVTFSVAANAGAARTGMLTIGGKTFTVTQTARSCTFAIAPPSASVPAAGGGGNVTVTAGAGCGWTAASNASWLTIATGASGTGNGTVTFTASGNTTGATRSGALTIGGQTFTVTQTALPCSYTVTPPAQIVPASGGAGTITVKTGGACPWSATVNVPWITITAPASGTGDGTVRFTVAVNHGLPRAGTVTVGGIAVTVSQLGI